MIISAEVMLARQLNDNRYRLSETLTTVSLLLMAVYHISALVHS